MGFFLSFLLVAIISFIIIFFAKVSAKKEKVEKEILISKQDSMENSRRFEHSNSQNISNNVIGYIYLAIILLIILSILPYFV